ncbi:UNVERIFIED_CONTAM: ATP-dependent DNA helicase PIF6 [Sesamum radiatum]|uniref:ATP-dependent DNA helicase n=1 Tax=Sesamum radiatum TaxID=300843 RepID=A0AAW2U951_SESRA
MDSEDSNMDIDSNDTQVERTREQNRVRARRRRQRMRTEERKVANTTVPAIVADVNAYQTTSRHTQALHVEGNQRVVPLACSIPIPITIADGNRSITSTSVAQTSGSTRNTTVGTALLHQIPLANFDQVPANQFEASTSRAQPSNNGDHGNNDYNLSSSSSDDLHDPPNVGEGVNYIRPRHNRFLNDARNYYPASDGHGLQLPTPRICSHYRAKLFHREAKSFCCRGGKAMLPEIPVPVDLMRLFTDQSAEGRIFRQNIRAYNHVFSFTSMGVALDQNLAPFDQGIYTFKAHGSIYHRIKSLLPLPGTRPRYIQMFIYDTKHEIENRLQESNDLDGELSHNPFVKTLRQLAQRSDINNCKLVIKEKPAPNMQYTLPTASQVAAILVGGEEIMDANDRDIIVQSTTGRLFNIKEYSSYYDPLQYPLLLPYGTYGWDCDFHSFQGNRITCCDYYAYILQIRGAIPSILLHGGRLLQQYVVDNYVKIETQKLRRVRFHQHDIRAVLNEGLRDCLDAGENDAGQTSQDRPDLLTRIFRAKCEELKEDIFHRGILGKAIAHVHVIEFQKRGLPHVYMLVIFDEDDKLNTPDDYDCIVRAKIPKQDEEPELYVAIIKHMIHGPCGHIKLNAPCIKNGRCKKCYPKQFAECTMQGNDLYPIYRPQNDNRSIALDNDGQVVIDNSWVVPYNSWLLLKYDFHINVEVCSSIKSVKYLYKCVYKGPDCVVFEVRPGPNYDEINQYVDGRWICAPEMVFVSENLGKEKKHSKGYRFSAFDVISRPIRRKHSAIFFVDGPGGTGIAANLLPGGRTAHSKLKIPIKFEPLSMCRFSKQSELSTLIERASAIIWNEAPMANRKAFETVDRIFRDILGVDLPFGGKVMILGGDFRQVLPVVIGEYIANRTLLTPLNDDVNKLIEEVLTIFHGEEVTYYSFDLVADDARNLYLPEFLNSLSPGSLPPHKLTLKRGSPIMLLRNIDPKIGLCNGTRLICHRFGRNIIEAEILAGQCNGMRVFLPRIPLKSAEDANISFEMTRRQFPIRLSFALTINKSQGQTIPNVGIYLRSHVFSHGQLYVALSRGVSERTKILVRKGSVIGHEGVYTKNVVFKEIFANLQSSLTITQGGR